MGGPAMVRGDQGQRWQRIYLELTNACDCACAFCPRSSMTRGVEHMNLGLAKRLLSEIAALGLAPKVAFHVLGEPTLHPHLDEVLYFAIRLGLHTSLVTNGMGLAGALGERLAELPIGEIALSIQTPDAASFRYRQAPLGFEAYRRGIMAFLGRHFQAQPETRFHLRFLSTFLFERAHHTGSLYGSACSEFGPLRAAVSDWARWSLAAIGVAPSVRRQRAERLTGLRLYRWNRIELHERLHVDIWPMLEWRDWSCKPRVGGVIRGDCLHRRDHLAVLSNGEVVLCCMDFNGRTSLGSVNRCLLTDVLQGARAHRVLGGFAQGRVELPFCRRCLGRWQANLVALRGEGSLRSTQRALSTTLQSVCRLWES